MANVPGPISEPPRGGPSFALVGLGIEVALILLVLPLGSLLGQSPLETLRWAEPEPYSGLLAVLLGLAGALPMILAFFLLLHVPIGPAASLRRFSREVLAPLLRTCTTVEIVLLALFAGLAEELAFRGLLQAFLTRESCRMTGLLLAGLIFGLLHAINLAYFVLAALAGLYLGLIWLVTDNLLVPIVAHAAYDLVAMLVLANTSEDSATSSPA